MIIPEDATPDLWRLSLADYAHRMSGGKWIPYRWIKYVADQVSAGILKGNARFIIETPPRHGKSETFAKWLSAWFLDLFADRRVMLTSYGEKLAASHGRWVRNQLQRHPDSLTEIRKDKDAANDWATTQGGGMLSAGIMGGHTGHGADLFIADDLIKNWREATSAARRRSVLDEFTATFLSRLEPGASVVVIGTRWHARDPSGALQADMPGEWTVIRLPALAEANDPLGRKPGEALCPERYDEERLLKIQSLMPPRQWSGLFQQRPTSSESAIIRESDLRFWYVGDEPHRREVVSPNGKVVSYCEQKEFSDLVPEQLDGVITSWDMNFKNKKDADFVAGHAWGWILANALLLDRRHGRFGFRKSVEQMLDLRESWKTAEAHLVEDAANGPAILEVIQDAIPGAVPVSTGGISKESRLEAVSPMTAAGQVWFPHPEMPGYEWVEEVIDEIVNYPAQHDDDADAFSQALRYIAARVRVNEGDLIF